jgi:hypothetical protein
MPGNVADISIAATERAGALRLRPAALYSARTWLGMAGLRVARARITMMD